MNVNYKEYDFSLNGSEIRVIKKALNLALCLSHPENDDEKIHEHIVQLYDLFIDEAGHCNDAYLCVTNFLNLL